MKISKYDLCETCRNKRMPTGDTFGESIDQWNDPSKGVVTNQNYIAFVIQMFQVNLEKQGGCSKCISYFKKLRGM